MTAAAYLRIDFHSVEGKKLTRILENTIPTAKDDSLQASIYGDIDEIVDVYQFWENDDYFLRTKNGIDLQKPEVDQFLSLKLRESTSHLPRIPKSADGKIESITTIQNGPTGQTLNGKPIEEIPRAKRIEIANRIMTKCYTEINSLTDEDMLLAQEELRIAYDFVCKQVAARNLKAFHRNIGESTESHESKLERKKALREEKLKRKRAKLRARDKGKLYTTKHMQVCLIRKINWNNAEELKEFTDFMVEIQGPDFKLDFEPNKYKFEDYKK